MNPKEKPSFFSQAITYLANLIILNLLFLLCSLPLITYGASLSALFTMVRAINEGESVVSRGFFRAFREQFRQSTLGWLVMLLPGAVMYVEAALLLQVNVDVPDFLYVSLLVPATVYCGLLPWVLIQSSYFTCTLKQTLKNAVLLAMQLLPQTVVLAAAQLLPVALFLLRTVDFLRLWPLWLFVYFAAAYAIAERLLKNPMQQLTASLRADTPSDQREA